MEIEEGGDGIWNIVGGKVRELSVTLFLAAVLICFFLSLFILFLSCEPQPSCRRNFSLDVMLLDSSGQPVLKELEVCANDINMTCLVVS